MYRIVPVCLIAVLANFNTATAQGADPVPAASTLAPDDSVVEEKATALSNNLYVIAGVGGNTGGNVVAAIGPHGLVLVDTQFPQFYDKLRAKIRSLSDKPIIYVVDTHYHSDHAGSNASFHTKDKAIIVAHSQVVDRLVHPRPRDGRPAPPASPKEALPDAPYSGDASILDAGGLTVQLDRPVPGAHTDGDTVVVFPEANVIATGDLFVSNAYPLIDIESGGSINGLIAGTDFILAHSDNNTKIVPGHGPVTNKNGLAEYRAMLVRARDILATAKANGMTEEQLNSANLLQPLDPQWNGSNRSVRFATAVYRTLQTSASK